MMTRLFSVFSALLLSSCVATPADDPFGGGLCDHLAAASAAACSGDGACTLVVCDPTQSNPAARDCLELDGVPVARATYAALVEAEAECLDAGWNWQGKGEEGVHCEHEPAVAVACEPPKGVL